MSRVVKHKILQGEGLAKIAARYVTEAETIWEHPANQALHQRTQPEVLPPGELISVPTPTFTTNQTHRISLRLMSDFKIHLIDTLKRPLADLPCRIVVGDAEQSVTTDSEGVLTARVRIDTRAIDLYMGDATTPVQLLVSFLDPVDTAPGVEARLANLGFTNESDGAVDPSSPNALAAFQTAEGVTPSGVADGDTQARLVERHLV